jgi:probable HAF family extracellular repeat protein
MRFVIFLAALPVCAWPIYQVVDLGPSAATAVNANGVAVGWVMTSSQTVQATRSGQGIGSAAQSRAYGINDAGQVVGVRYDVYGNAEAVLWQPDGTETGLAGANSYAMGINGAGAAAGAVNGQAVRFSQGGIQSIPVNAPWSAAKAINDSGAVAGTAQLSSGAFRAFTATSGNAVTMLGTLGGWSSYGQAINSAGWVAGGSTTVTGYLHAFLYANGQMKDLGTLAGGGNSSAYGANSLGQVVGYSQIAGGDSSAFLWENGQLRDLNELIAADTGWRLLEASGINDQGQIVGFGIFDGIERAFRLDPISLPDEAAAIPEPSSWVLAAIGVAGIALGLARPGYFN